MSQATSAGEVVQTGRLCRVRRPACQHAALNRSLCRSCPASAPPAPRTPVTTAKHNDHDSPFAPRPPAAAADNNDLRARRRRRR